MVPWDVTAHGHQYITDSWALYAVAAGLVVALVSLSLALLPPAGAGQDEPAAGLGFLSAMVFLLGVAFVLLPVAAWWWSDDPLFGGGEARSYMVFRQLLRLEVGWSAVTTLVVSMSLLGAKRRRISARVRRPAVLVGMAAVVLAASAAGHAILLVRVDCLPRLERVGHGYLHVGRPRQLEVASTCGSRYQPPPPVEVVASAAGPVDVTLSRSYPMIEVRRSLALTAGRESGPERLQVRAGNVWTYERREVSRMTSHFVEQGRREERDEVRLSVLEPRLVEGLQIFPVEVHFPWDEAPVRLEVVGFDGRLATFDRGEMSPLIGPGSLDEPVDDFLVPGVCRGEPPEGAPKAPAECRVPVNTLAGLGATMLRILTLGTATYVPGREVYRLVGAEWGPEGGPEIPIEVDPGA